MFLHDDNLYQNLKDNLNKEKLMLYLNILEQNMDDQYESFS